MNRRFLKIGLITIAGLAGGGAAVLTIAFAIVGSTLPELKPFDQYQPAVGTQVFSADNQLIAEFAEEQRIVIPPAQMPPQVYQAFISAEDKRFYSHFGFDPVGIVQAIVQKILHPSTRLRGASTITQQLAKSLLADHGGYAQATERTVWRKLRELALALRLESRLEKSEILYMYVHEVFLGHRSYGVAAAARNYFRKSVDELTVAEIATLAGLPQRPSAYSPYANPRAALKRRWYVLGRMLDDGYITAEQFDVARYAYVKTYATEQAYLQVAPYFSEEVRRKLVEQFGEEAVLSGGYVVETGASIEAQAAARRAVRKGLLALDKRQGYRGPLLTLRSQERRDVFRAAYRQSLGLKNEEDSIEFEADRVYLATITAFDKRGRLLTLDVAGQKGLLPLAGIRWARKPDPTRSFQYGYLFDARFVVGVGDVIEVVITSTDELRDDVHGAAIKHTLPATEKLDAPVFRLHQEPTAQAALMAVSPRSGYVLAQVGGRDFSTSSFNRVTQACREPGSAFKPVVYSAALEELDYTPSTLIDDKPLVFDDPDNAVRWKPENYETEFRGSVTLRECLRDSINIPALRVAEALGIDAIIDMARAFGITTDIKREWGTALGASCTTMAELLGVYVAINQYGVRHDPIYIRRIRDREGNVLVDNTVPWDLSNGLRAQIERSYVRSVAPGKRVMRESNAFVMQRLLHNVVTDGTATRALETRQQSAGKTGTTNDSYDAWFMGFTRNLVAGVWVGHDLKDRPLGAGEQGAATALPIWADFVKQYFVDNREIKPKRWRDSYFYAPKSVVRVWIDPATGLLARKHERNAVWEYYRKGTEPTEYSPEHGSVNASNMALYEVDEGF